MTHSYAMYGYAGYVKHGYTTWLRHVRLCRLYQIRLRRVITLHTELRHSASLRHPRHSSHHSHVTPPRHSHVTPPRHSASLLASLHIIPPRRESREGRYADHIFIQIYFRMHHFVGKFSKCSSPQAARGHWPPIQNPADACCVLPRPW